MQIGAQFYTVRNQCQTLDDFALTLRKVADIGYKTVQISGTCPFDAQWLKEQLDATGLKCVLTHIPAQRLQEEAAQVRITCGSWATARSFPPPPWSPSPSIWLMRLSCPL